MEPDLARLVAGRADARARRQMQRIQQMRRLPHHQHDIEMVPRRRAVHHLADQPGRYVELVAAGDEVGIERIEAALHDRGAFFERRPVGPIARPVDRLGMVRRIEKRDDEQDAHGQPLPMSGLESVIR